nr:bifunctional DNA primase/polymerase [Kitasatospora sp. NRRL B-11411]
MTAELWARGSGSARPRPAGSEIPAGSGPWATARWCAARGWPVLPLASGRKTPAGNCAPCRVPGHHHQGCACLRSGRWCHGFHAATVDQALVDRWWSGREGFGVGISCGPAGLVVVDVDAHRVALPGRDRLLPGIVIPEGADLTGLENGFHTLAVLAALHGEASPAEDTGTLRVRTPSGGLHVWYRALPGQRWLCSTGSSSGRALAWQVDVRAYGGYIVAPGTRTAAGDYTPVDSVREPAPLPGWLAHELRRTGHLTAPQPVAEPGRAAVPQRALAAVLRAGGGRRTVAGLLAGPLAEVAACGALAQGAGFSERLNRAAYTAGGLAAAGYLTEAEAVRALTEAAGLARPGQERRAAAIIRSGLRAGARRPLMRGTPG